MVVVGVVLVVVVVGPLVVSALVVVGLVLRYGPRTPCGYSGPPSGGGGSGIVRSPWVCTVWWAGGAGQGPGLRVIVVEGSHVPGSVWPAAVVVCGGWMTGRLEMGMFTRVWTGSCWVAASVVAAAAGGRGAWVVVGWGVLVWVRVWVRAVFLGLASLRLWCCVRSFGRRLGFRVGFGVGVRFQVEEDLGTEV